MIVRIQVHAAIFTNLGNLGIDVVLMPPYFFLKLLVSWDFLKLESVEPEQKVSHQQMASFRKKTKSGRRRKLLLHFLCNKLRTHLSATHCTQVTAFL